MRLKKVNSYLLHTHGLYNLKSYKTYLRKRIKNKMNERGKEKKF